MPNTAERRIVINIVCPGHSGSTLLGNLLGSHEHGIHIGELVAPLKKQKPVVCRSCLSNPCPIWGTILTQEFVYKVYDDFISKRKLFRGWFRSYPGTIYEKLFEACNDLKFVIDSSKNIKWYMYNASNRSLRHKYIFLKRDIPAVLASYKRAYNVNIGDSASSVGKTIREINSFHASLPPHAKYVVAYEDLVGRPEQQIKGICDFLDIAYQPEMLLFNKKVHHVIGGNHGLIIQNDHSKVDEVDRLIDYKTPQDTVNYYRSLNGIKLDERWKNELSDEEKVLITKKLGDPFTF